MHQQFRICDQKKSRRLTMSEDRAQADRISNLPDSILHDRILSLIPTKEVVNTSILSKRWKNLWHSVPNIDFDDELLYATEINRKNSSKVASFMKFVERVLQLRGGLNLDKFHLTCYGSSNFSQIHSWVSYAIRHKIQELGLCFLTHVYPADIPWYLFHTTWLVSLKLDTNRFVIVLPSHNYFPCLKTLHLSSITFLSGDSIQKLISCCRVLEELILSDSQWKDSWFIVICSSTLKTLRIHNPFYSGSINIHAENLKCFDYTGNLSNKILLKNAFSLVDVCIHIATPQKLRRELARRVVDLVKYLKDIVSLSASNWTIESLKVADNKPVPFPIFPNLIRLTLTTEIKNSTFQALMDFVYFCPLLQSICFSEGFTRFVRIVENKSIESSLPICMTNSLKRLTMKEFHGYNSEIRFLQFVLKYANVLERMDLFWSETYLRDLKKKKRVMNELEKTERKSAVCVIKIS